MPLCRLILHHQGRPHAAGENVGVVPTPYRACADISRLQCTIELLALAKLNVGLLLISAVDLNLFMCFMLTIISLIIISLIIAITNLIVISILITISLKHAYKLINRNKLKSCISVLCPGCEVKQSDGLPLAYVKEEDLIIMKY